MVDRVMKSSFYRCDDSGVDTNPGHGDILSERYHDAPLLSRSWSLPDEAPSSKHQIPNKLQGPILKARCEDRHSEVNRGLLGLPGSENPFLFQIRVIRAIRGSKAFRERCSIPRCFYWCAFGISL
jgi:hypothetical protein